MINKLWLRNGNETVESPAVRCEDDILSQNRGFQDDNKVRHMPCCPASDDDDDEGLRGGFRDVWSCQLNARVVMVGLLF